MAKIADIKDVQTILDPRSKYIFLDDHGMTEAFPIRGVKSNLILIEAGLEGKDNRKRSGYFVAVSGRGIVRFESSVKKISAKKSKGVITALSILLKSLQMVDRREFLRHFFERPLPILMKCEGKNVEALAVNMSEGGFRLSVDRLLPTQVVYHFEITLPVGEPPFTFKSDGLVVYCEPEDDPARFMAGIALIAPEFSSAKERKEYQKQRAKIVEFLNS